MYVQEFIKRNTAIDVNANAPGVNIHITEHGSDWLFAAFSVFGLLMVVNAFMYIKTNGVKRALFISPLITTIIMTGAYFIYASNLGNAGVPVEFTHADAGVRQVFYSKIIAWFLAWPWVLATCEVITHPDLTATGNRGILSRFVSFFLGLFIKIVAIEVYVLGVLVGSVVLSTYKWGFFAIGVFGLLSLIFLVGADLFHSFKNSAKSKVGNFLIIFILVVWILYPICWALSGGGNVIQPDSEAVFDGILDLINFGIVPTILTWIAIGNVDEIFFKNFCHYCDASPLANEKEIDTTPTHSGDTSVAPAGVTAVDEV